MMRLVAPGLQQHMENFQGKSSFKAVKGPMSVWIMNAFLKRTHLSLLSLHLQLGNFRAPRFTLGFSIRLSRPPPLPESPLPLIAERQEAYHGAASRVYVTPVLLGLQVDQFVMTPQN